MGSEPAHRASRTFAALRSVLVAAAPSRLLGPRFRGGNEWGVTPRLVPAERPLRGGPYSGSGTIAVPGPPLSRGKRMGSEPAHRAGGKPAALRSVLWQRRHRGS